LFQPGWQALACHYLSLDRRGRVSNSGVDRDHAGAGMVPSGGHDGISNLMINQAMPALLSPRNLAIIAAQALHLATYRSLAGDGEVRATILPCDQLTNRTVSRSGRS
jgi:hypothetical protein